MNKMGTWQRRWFVVANNCLYYFNKPEVRILLAAVEFFDSVLTSLKDQDPRCLIPLEGLCVAPNTEFKGRTCFEIFDPNQVSAFERETTDRCCWP